MIALKPPHTETTRGGRGALSLLARTAFVAALLVAGCAQRVANPSGAAMPGVGAGSPAPGAPGMRGYPFAAARTTTAEYHGVVVADDFGWLENPADPKTRSWRDAENAYSRRYLDAIPARAALYGRLQALMSSTSNAYSGLAERDGVIFALKSASLKPHPLLVALKSVDDVASERVVYDPNVAGTGDLPEIEFFKPSPDGKRVAIVVSGGAGETGTLRIIDVASGRMLADSLPRVASPGAGGDVAWATGGAGLYYTRYPPPGTWSDVDARFHQQLVFHKLGAPASEDKLELASAPARLAATHLDSSPDGRVVTVIMENGDSKGHSLYLKLADAGGAGNWRRIADEADSIQAVHVGDDGALYLVSRANAPCGKVLRLALAPEIRDVSLAAASVLVPQSDGAIQDFAVADNTLYVSELLGGPSQLRIVDIRTKRAMQVALPAVSGIDGFANVGGGEVVMHLTSFLAPPAWSHVTATGIVKPTALVTTSEATFDDAEVLREFATSGDGTRVPLNVIRRKGTRLDGRNPTILIGDGGFGTSMTPQFRAEWRPWLDLGGVFVVANLRGGGEYGEDWHQAGSLTKKQHVFDDFIASADYLVKQGYTQPRLLGIMGSGSGSGGLLMGAAMTQRPDLFAAVVSSAGIYDMLRAELDSNGPFKISEYGSVKDRAQFAALFAYSPLRSVRDGVAYPSVLMLTGENDGGANPAESRKMIARLQQADPDGRVILLRAGGSGSHAIGMALSERIAKAVDVYGFFLHELAVTK